MRQIYFIGLLAVAFCIPAFSPAIAQQASPYEVEQQTTSRYKDFRVAVGGGYAYRLAERKKESDPALEKFSKQLMHGYAIDLDGQYFFKESWGLGLNANYVSTSASGDNITIPNVGSGNVSEKQGFFYVGPSFVSRSEYNRFLVLYSLSIGPLFFTDDVTYNGMNATGSATTVGLNAGIAGEYKINGKTGVGIKLSYTMGNINSINMEGQNIQSDEKISVSNLMITAFLSFRSW